MGGLLDILQINESIVSLGYGTVFLFLGLVAAQQSRESRKRSRLPMALHLDWLAAFGITVAVSEWGNVFIPIQATYLADTTITNLRVIQCAILALSFVLLAQFGILVGLPKTRWRRWIRIVPLLVLIAGIIALFNLHGQVDATALAGLETWARRLLALPGAALAGYGMLRQANLVEDMRTRRMANYFRLAAISMGAYGVLAGLVGPQAGIESGASASYNLVISLFGIPVQVLRALTGIGIVVGTSKGLQVFEVEMARFIAETEGRRLESAERARSALDRIATTISQPHELDGLLDKALGTVVEVTQGPAAWMMLVDSDDERLSLRAYRTSARPTNVGFDCVPRPGCACLEVKRGIVATPRSTHSCHLWPASILPFGFAGVPLQARERVVGILCIAAPSREWGDAADLGLLKSIGRHIGLAVENARLWDELQEKEALRSHLLKRVITAQEEERRRVALELHDDTGQSLTAVIMGLGAARSVLARDPARASGMLEETRELAVHALRGVRELILGLRPASLDDLGLVPALHRLGEDIGRRGGFQVEIDGSGLHRRLPPEVETVLFRIVQEGFNNVAQHSRAKRVRLSFRILGRDVEATLEDDGIGFDLPKVRGTRGGLNGLGLVGMQERASLLNGRVEIQSRPGKGTQLTLRLPCSASPANSAADDGAEQQLDPVEITSGSD